MVSNVPGHAVGPTKVGSVHGSMEGHLKTAALPRARIYRRVAGLLQMNYEGHYDGCADLEYLFASECSQVEIIG